MPELTQPMSNVDRGYLAEIARTHRQASRAFFEYYLVHLWFTGVSCFLAGGAWVVILWAFGVLNNARDWTRTPVAFWGVAAISLVVCGYILGSQIRNMRFHKDQLVKIKADLAAGLVLTDTMTVHGAKGFVEPEHLMRIYTLKGQDDRVFVIFDYDSVNLDGGDTSKPTKLRFAKELTVKRFPQSGLVHYSFSGEPIRKPRAIPMAAKPQKWPKPERFWDVPWAGIEARLAA